MTCQDFTENLDDFVTGTMPSNARMDMDVHAANCPICRPQLRDLEEAAALVWLSVPQVEPPPRLRKRLMSKCKHDHRVRAKPPLRWRWSAGQSALAVSAVALGITLVMSAWVWTLQAELGRQATDSARLRDQIGRQRDALYVLMSPTLVERPVQGSDAAPMARGRVYLDPNRRQGMLVASDLPRLEPDRTYQVWLRGKDGIVNAGVMRVDDRGTGYALLDPSTALDQYETVGVSVEPAGGSLQPTGPGMMLGSL